MSGFIRGICVGIGISWLIAPMKGQELRHLLVTRWAEISGSTQYQELTMPMRFSAIQEGKAATDVLLKSTLDVQESEAVTQREPRKSVLDVQQDTRAVTQHEPQESALDIPLPLEQPENKVQEEDLHGTKSSNTVQAPPHSQPRKKRKRRATS